MFLNVGTVDKNRMPPVIDTDKWVNVEDLTHDLRRVATDFEATGIRGLNSGMLADLVGMLDGGRGDAVESPFSGPFDTEALFESLGDKLNPTGHRVESLLPLRYPTDVIVRNATGDVVWTSSFDDYWHVDAFSGFTGRFFLPLARKILGGRIKTGAVDRFLGETLRSLLELLDLSQAEHSILIGSCLSRHVSPESPTIPAVHLPRFPRELRARLHPLVRVLFPVTVR